MTNGNIEKYSEAWYEMQQEINDVNEAIQDSNTSIIEFGNSIREIQWDIFDKIQDMISGITDESDFLIDLMSSKDMFDDNGDITDQGKATMGLHGVNYNTYMSQADEYRKEMEAIDAELKKSPYNQDLIERRKELLELQQESILAAEDEKEAIKDLVEDGINKQLDSLQDLIDKYTDLMDNQKDLYDYQKNLAKKQKEINEVEKQLMAYKNDDSEEGAANRQKLQNELNELKVEMEETQYDQSIVEQKKLLDELYNEYETILNMRLDNIDILISDVINNVNAEASLIRDAIISEADSVGYQLTDSMNTIWTSMESSLDNGASKIANVITVYGDKFTLSLTSVQTAINDLKNIVQQGLKVSDSTADANIKNANASQTAQTTTTKPSTSTSPKTTSKSTSGGDGVPRVGDKVTFASGRYYYSSDGMSPTGNQMLGKSVYITSINNASWATKPYHISTGSKLGNGDLGWLTLSQLKGYRTGSKYIRRDQWARVNEDGDEIVLSDGAITMADGTVLRKLNQGDKVLTSAQTDNMYEWAKISPVDLFSKALVDSQVPEFTPVSNSSNIQNDINLNIEIDRVMDYNDFVTQLKQDNKFEKFIQEATLGRAMGHGKLKKYQI